MSQLTDFRKKFGDIELQSDFDYSAMFKAGSI